MAFVKIRTTYENENHPKKLIFKILSANPKTETSKLTKSKKAEKICFLKQLKGRKSKKPTKQYFGPAFN